MTTDPYIGGVFKLKDETVVEVIAGPFQGTLGTFPITMYECRYREPIHRGATCRLGVGYLDGHCQRVTG